MQASPTAERPLAVSAEELPNARSSFENYLSAAGDTGIEAISEFGGLAMSYGAKKLMGGLKPTNIIRRAGDAYAKFWLPENASSKFGAAVARFRKSANVQDFVSEYIEELGSNAGNLLVPESADAEWARNEINEVRRRQGLEPITRVDEAFSADALKQISLAVGATQDWQQGKHCG